MMRIPETRQAALLSYRLLVLATSWWLTAGLAWAQNDLQTGGATKSYVLPYLMVILVVALGLLIVLRSSGRASDVKVTKEED